MVAIRACVLLVLGAAGLADPICEQRDGDCPKCPLLASFSPTATLHLSAVEPALVRSAAAADATIRGIAAATNTTADIISFDAPATGLHTSMFYFCCHALADLTAMKAALQAMVWQSFDVRYDGFSCNDDMHGSGVTYLHALPSAPYQIALFALAGQIETALRAAGVAVNHPRQSLFHMTLGRVREGSAFPVAAVSAALNGTFFGAHRVCKFEFEGVEIVAEDGCGNTTSARAL
jgi:2'-5' RNA ligase